MIGSIRRYAQKSGVKVILWLTLFSLVGSSFVFLIRFRKSDGNAVASVGGYDISVTEFRRKYLPLAHFSQEIKRKYGPQADAILKLWGLSNNPEQVALDSLVQEKIVEKAFDTLGTQTSKEYTDSMLRDPYFVNQTLGDIVPSYALQGGILNIDVLKKSLDHMGISEDEFETSVQDAVNRALFEKLVQGSAYISQEALKEYYLRLYAKKKFGILSLGLDSYLKKAREAALTDQEIATFYKEQKNRYAVPEKRSGTLWSFSPENYALSVTDKDVENYYYRNRQEYLERPQERQIQRIVLKVTSSESEKEQQKRAQELTQELKEHPERFEQLAQKFSQGAEKGSTIGVKKGQKGQVFDQIVFALGKDSISPVIKSTEGFEIIKLVGIKEAVYKDLKAVKDEIRKKLILDKFKQDFTTDAHRVVSQATDVPDILTKFIQEKKAQQSTLSRVTSDKPGITTEKLFSLSKEGDKAFYIEGDKGYILQFDDRVKSFVPELQEIKDRVAKDIYTQKAQKLMQQDLDSIYQAIGTTSLEKVANQGSGRVYKVTPLINPQDEQTLKKVTAEGMPVEQGLLLTESKSAIKHIEDTKGFIIQLLEIEPLDQKQFELKKKELMIALVKQELQALGASFMENLKKQATVKTNNDMLRLASRL